MQIAIASSSRVGTPLVDALSKSQHQLAYVVTNPDKKSGRGLATKANSFVESISKFDVSVHKPTSHAELHALLLENPVDLVITASYGRLIKPEELNLPKYGWLNVHFSLLPKYRGASPVQQAIINGDELTGVSIFRLDEGMDTGPIFGRYEYQIAPNTTTPALLTDLAEFAAGKIAPLLDEIEDGLLPSPQSTEGISLAGKFSKEDGRIFPSHCAVVAERLVRALGDNPGVFIFFRGHRLGIDAAQLVEQAGTAGTLTANKTSLFLNLADGALQLQTVIPQGKKKMSGADFARGARIEGAEAFE